jgi:hypothetical protein
MNIMNIMDCRCTLCTRVDPFWLGAKVLAIYMSPRNVQIQGRDEAWIGRVDSLCIFVAAKVLQDV